jgi:hypothetical protein
MYPQGLVALDLKAEAKTHDIAIALRRGVTIKGRLEGPEGKPVIQATIYSPTHIPLGYKLNPARPIEGKDGRFELHGLNPEKATKIYFLDSARQLGAMKELSGKQAGDTPLTVRLQPCGSATARFVDARGQPLKDFRPDLELLLTPGASLFDPEAQNQLLADTVGIESLDQQRYRKLQPDAQGRFTFPTLIPGAIYRLTGAVPYGGFLKRARTFTAEAGKTLDLKDIPIDSADEP